MAILQQFQLLFLLISNWQDNIQTIKWYSFSFKASPLTKKAGIITSWVRRAHMLSNSVSLTYMLKKLKKKFSVGVTTPLYFVFLSLPPFQIKNLYFSLIAFKDLCSITITYSQCWIEWVFQMVHARLCFVKNYTPSRKLGYALSF